MCFFCVDFVRIASSWEASIELFSFLRLGGGRHRRLLVRLSRFYKRSDLAIRSIWKSKAWSNFQSVEQKFLEIHFHSARVLVFLLSGGLG